MFNVVHVIPMVYTRARLQIVIRVMLTKMHTTASLGRIVDHAITQVAGAMQPSITTIPVSRWLGSILMLVAQNAIKMGCIKAHQLNARHAIETNIMERMAPIVQPVIHRRVGATRQ